MAKTNTQAISPVGTAVWASITKPDTKYVPEGEYKVKLSITGDGAQKLSAFLDGKLQESIAEAKKNNEGKKIKEGSAGYTWVDDNTVEVTFKMKAAIKLKSGETWNRKPALFDAKGKPLVGEVLVGRGSKLAVAYETVSYFKPLTGAGVSLRLNAVQIVELVEYAGGAGNPGFGEHDGYEADDEVATPFTAKAEDKPADGSDF
jgi:hypothetical protein